MVDVKRKKGESFESMMRRFRKRIQSSGTMLQVKKIQFYSRQKSKSQRRESALTRRKMSEKREYLIKVGKLKEDEVIR